MTCYVAFKILVPWPCQIQAPCIRTMEPQSLNCQLLITLIVLLYLIIIPLCLIEVIRGFLVCLFVCLFLHYFIFKFILLLCCAELCSSVFDPMNCSPPGSLSMGFPKLKYWRVLPFPPPSDLPDPGVKPVSPMLPELAGRFFTIEQTGKANSVVFTSPEGALQVVIYGEASPWNLCGILSTCPHVSPAKLYISLMK